MKKPRQALVSLLGEKILQKILSQKYFRILVENSQNILDLVSKCGLKMDLLFSYSDASQVPVFSSSHPEKTESGELRFSNLGPATPNFIRPLRGLAAFQVERRT